METFFQLLIFGLQLGSVYALIAIGYSMVYGIVKMINFAHGDFLMIGAFVGYFLLTSIPDATKSLGIVIGVILISMLVTGVLGALTERIAYKPLRNKARLSTLITAIGVSMFLENFPRALPFIGPSPRMFPKMFPDIQLNMGGVSISTIQIIMIVASALSMLVMEILTDRSKWGKQMRAVSFDRDAASLMGININRIISLTFLIGAALAAMSGMLYSNIYWMIHVYMGGWLGTKAFIAAVFGGIGNIRGAMLGGILLGIIEVLATYINSDVGYGIAFVMLIFVLLFKPAGLLGKAEIEKV